MASYYTYLLSSLPMLQYGARPPFSVEKFLKMCEGLIAEEEMHILGLSLTEKDRGLSLPQPTLKKWRDFEISLKNELVKIRALRKHVDGAKYIREDGYFDASVPHIAINAYRAGTILDTEKALDQERWRVLEGLGIGHYFDLDALILYGQKLVILNRWETIRTGDKNKMLEETVSAAAG